MEGDTETQEQKAPKSHDYEIKQGNKHDPETTLKYCSHVQLQREPKTCIYHEYDTEAHVTQPTNECKQESCPDIKHVSKTREGDVIEIEKQVEYNIPKVETHR